MKHALALFRCVKPKGPIDLLETWLERLWDIPILDLLSQPITIISLGCFLLIHIWSFSINVSQSFWLAFPIGAYAKIKKSSTSFFMLSLTNRQTAITLASRSLWTIDPVDLQAVTAFLLRRIPTPCSPHPPWTRLVSNPLLLIIQVPCSSVLTPVLQVPWRQAAKYFYCQLLYIVLVFFHLILVLLSSGRWYKHIFDLVNYSLFWTLAVRW